MQTLPSVIFCNCFVLEIRKNSFPIFLTVNMPLISLATPQETLDSEKVLEIRRAKWKKRLEEPARKMLKVSHGKNRAGDESEVSEG